MRNKDDPIIYFTLIDFLIQIIFFTLFIAVVYVSGSQKSKAIPEELGWVTNEIYWPMLNDLTPFIKQSQQDEIKKLLKVFQDNNALEEFLAYIKNKPNLSALFKSLNGIPPDTAKKIIEWCNANPDACTRFAFSSTTKPSCLSGAPLFDVNAYDDRLVIAKINNLNELSKLRVALRVGEVIPKNMIHAKFINFSDSALNCVYRIKYNKKGDSEDMRHATEVDLRLNIIR